jgi:chemosensory pili system protein ChpA (sensor histidine kinase/response regulator)
MRNSILVVDDDIAVRESLARVLESENYEVLLAAEGKEAVQIIREGAPDLVLLDITMPGKNGWDIFERIEKLYPMLPVIIITARPNQQPRASGYGIDALMEKPLDFPVLLATIERLLGEAPAARISRLSSPAFATTLLSPALSHH